MRLTCPNCAAQYEVEEDVIPEAGRDVQCSNCGHTWYQRPNSRPLTRPRTQPIQAEEESAAEAPATQEIAEAEPVAAPAARPMGEDVSSILREEAEREINERASERDAAGLEMQPELGGLDNDIAQTPANLAESEAVLDDPDHDGAEAAAAAIASRGATRKDLLPDIEEINSTLSPEEQVTYDDETSEVQDSVRRSGFRRGFLFIVLIFIIMVAVYVLAPKIVEMNPQTAGAMSAYVDWVNGLRAGLDGMMAGITERLSSLVDSIGSSN